jgi:hypothetical protein
LDATASVPGAFTYTPVAGTVLAAGSQSLSVSFVPTGSTTAQTAKTTLVVNQATTTTTLTAGTPVNSSVTLSAAVTSVAGGAVTGTVSFFYGTAPLGTATLNASGQATYTGSLPAGSLTLTANYSGDANNLASTSTTAVQTSSGGTAFTLSANPTKVSLSAGQSNAITLSVVPSTTLAGAVSFTCTGLPTGSTCSFQPATLTGGSSTTAMSTTLTIALPAGSSAKAEPPSSGRSAPSLAGLFVLPASLLGLFLFWQRKRLQSSLWICILASVFLLGAGIGCGSSSTFSSGNASVGSYNALITATAPGSVETLTIPVSLVQ